MPKAYVDKDVTIDRVVEVIDTIMGVDLGDLELLVQQAHECDINQITDPPEPFPVSRQVLRMFWRFRRILESVGTMPAHG